MNNSEITLKHTRISILSIMIIGMMGMGTVTVFAEVHSLSVVGGSSVPGCEEFDGCYSNFETIIKVGDEVRWYNGDNAAHTVTSGSEENGPDGHFDSSLFMNDSTFSHTFEEAGKYPYFCMVHPWMEGIVVVKDYSTTDLSVEDTQQSFPSSSLDAINNDDDKDDKITQLQNEISILKSENDSLKDEIEKLQSEIEQLEDIIINTLRDIYNWVS